jgi:hypothetical protein
MTPRRRPTRPPTQDPAVVQSWRELAYSWPCPQCPCQTNLRGLLRTTCAHCDHEHQPPAHEPHPAMEDPL